MKKLTKLLIPGFAILLCTLTATAQKIAHVDLDSVISLMPESAAAEKQGEEFSKQLEQQMMSMQKELQEKYEKFQADHSNMTPIVQDTKRKELEDLNARIGDFQQQAQLELQKKEAELIKPIVDKVKKAVAQVAKENNYRYVLDTSSGVVIYTEPMDDIITLVIKKLGISTPPTNPKK